MSGYDLDAYGRMIADERRTDAYVRALETAVKPGDVVVDVGTGAGIFALVACKLGARHVYAIEPDDVIQVAREVAAANGFAPRITFIQDVSTRVSLPEPADVAVADVRGTLPLFRGSVATLIDARDRLLRPGGTLIPRRDTLYAAAVEAPDAHAEYVRPWADRPHGLDLSAALRRTLNSWGKARPRPADFLTLPAAWAVLDYATIRDTRAEGTVDQAVVRAGTLHGASAWFVGELAEGVTVSTSPAEPPAIYGTAFFPFATPVEVRPGDRVRMTFRADAVGGDYLWRWEVRVRRDDAVLAESTHSALRGAALTPERLRRRSHMARPAPSADARMTAFVLNAMDGGTTVGEIAANLRDAFPDRFPRWEDAVSLVGRLADEHGA